MNVPALCMVSLLILAAAVGAVTILLVQRLWAVLQSHHVTPRESLGLLIVAGSGGHTTEMLRLVGSLSRAYSPRHYVIAESDEMSASKIHSFERSRAERDSTTECPQYHLHRIPRSREVRQSWLSSVFTTLHSMRFSFPLVHQVLCNGPGTCVPICVSALLLGILGIKKVIIVYVESICRVETLSLSGKILRHLSDFFIVQWPTLKEKYPKSVYLGRIV